MVCRAGAVAVAALLMAAVGAHANDEKQAEAISGVAESAVELIGDHGGGIFLQAGYMSFGRVFNDTQIQTAAWGGQVDLLIGSPVGVLLGGAIYVPVYFAHTAPGYGRPVEIKIEPGDSPVAGIATLGPAFYVGGPGETQLVIGVVMHWSTVPMHPRAAENSGKWGGGVQLIGLHPLGKVLTLNAGARGHVELTTLDHDDGHSISFSWGASLGIGFRL